LIAKPIHELFLLIAVQVVNTEQPLRGLLDANIAEPGPRSTAEACNAAERVSRTCKSGPPLRFTLR
jgi:hypothetical protein